MSSDKRKYPVVMKTGTSEEWSMCEDKYIPAANTIIVYSDEDEAPRIKISDGIHKLGELPFINSTLMNDKDITDYKNGSPIYNVEGDLLEVK